MKGGLRPQLASKKHLCGDLALQFQVLVRLHEGQEAVEAAAGS